MNLLFWYRSLMRSVGAALVKLIVTATSGLVSFATNVIRPVKVVCKFSPVQEGTGDPSPDNVRPISGWTSATIYHTGKNVWGGRHAADQIKSVAGSKAIFSSDDDGDYISLTGIPGDAKQLSIGVEFKPNTAYTLILKARCSVSTNFTIRIFYTDGTQLVLSPSATYSETQIYRIVTAANKTIRGVYTLNRSQTLYIYYDYFGLFEGSISADDFEPYQGSTLPINWESESGTVYGGTVTLNEDGSVDLVSDVRFRTLAGTESWATEAETGTYNMKFKLNLSDMKYGSNMDGIASYIKARDTQAEGYKAGSLCCQFGWNDHRIFVLNATKDIADVSDLATWKAYLADHPLEIIYPLTTPTTYHFDNIGQLQSFLGTNNIWHNMNGDITVEYWNKQ